MGGEPARRGGRALDRRRRIGVAFAAALVVGVLGPFVAVVGPAEAARPPDLVCGVSPTTDVRLREDLTCEHGFHGESGWSPRPAVDIDLGGHTLTVTNDRCVRWLVGCGAISGYASVTHGTVVGDLVEIGLTSRVRLVGRAVLNPGYDSSITVNVFERSTVVDGSVEIVGSNVTVRDNRLERSSLWFDNLWAQLHNVQVLDNRIVDAPAPGIRVLEQFTCGPCPRGEISGVIAGNDVVRSAGAGIEVSGQLDSMGRLEIRGNTLRDNAGDGIRIDLSGLYQIPRHQFGPVILTANRADRNGGHGINSDWTSAMGSPGVVDDGDNTARHNGLAPPCVNVVCAGSG
jgi:hypothetical protein